MSSPFVPSSGGKMESTAFTDGCNLRPGPYKRRKTFGYPISSRVLEMGESIFPHSKQRERRQCVLEFIRIVINLTRILPPKSMNQQLIAEFQILDDNHVRFLQQTPKQRVSFGTVNTDKCISFCGLELTSCIW